MRELSRYRKNRRFYAGRRKKSGILISGEDYVIKYRRNSPEGKICDHVSEYLGSHILDMLGVVTQDTWLATCRGEEVVLCKDFTSQEENFISFDQLGEYFLDIKGEPVQYEYEQIMEVLTMFLGYSTAKEIINTFWDMVVIDAFVANGERGGRSWGLLKKGDQYSPAPVLGNDSCLFPDVVTDEQCREILASKEEMQRRIFDIPIPKIQHKGRAHSYYDIISGHHFRDCDRALWRMIQKIDFEAVNYLVESVAFTSNIRKKFLITILEERYKNLLLRPFEKRM